MDISRIEHSYNFICNRELVNETLPQRIIALQYLEKELDLDFKNTEDFHDKMHKAFIKLSGAKELKRAREDKGWSQERLAKHLGVTRPFITQMESGIRPLTRKAIDFIECKQNRKT